MLSLGAFICLFYFPCPKDFPCNYKPVLSPGPGFSCSSQCCWDSWPYWSTAPPWQWAWGQVLINTYLDSCWTVKKYSCFQHVLASYQSPGGKMCGVYCDSLILCLSHHSNHGPGVEPASLGSTGEAARHPAHAACLFYWGISHLERFQKDGSWSCHGVSKTCWWGIVRPKPDKSPQSALLLASPGQGCALPQSHYSDF